MKKWSYHERMIRDNKELSDSDKETILLGICHIKKVLGEDFLKIAVRERHPILEYFLNSAPWTRFWLKEFGDMLFALEESIRFEKMRKRLRSRENFSSAMVELDVAYRFKKIGFVVEFYPKRGRYECDLKVQKQEINAYIEVAAIGPSEEERKMWFTFNELTRSYMLDRDVEVAGKIYKALSHPRIAEIKRIMKSHVRKAKREQKCSVISQPGIVEIIICPRSQSSQVSKWLKQKGISSHFEGPSYNVDEIRRARRAFRDENRQLPKNEPGLVVLYHGKIFVKGDVGSYRALINKLEEEIYEHSNLIAGVLIFSDAVGSSEVGSYGPNCVWSRKTKYQLFGENTVVIINKYSKFEVSEDIVTTLIV